MLSHNAIKARLVAGSSQGSMALGSSKLLDASFVTMNFWDAFGHCQFPIQVWLLVSALSIYALRLANHFGKSAASSAPEGESFLLNLRQKEGSMSKLLLRFIWLVATPFFIVWTVVGTYWLAQTLEHTPDCMPEGGHTSLVYIWQLFSYAWIVSQAVIGRRAWLLEGRLRRAESTLRELGDADTIARWGEDFSQLSGVQSLPALDGLAPSELGSLPGAASWSQGEEDCDCAICLAGFNEGDKIRTLCGCQHTFHRSCIDLWLLRRAECPLCKQTVSAQGEQTQKKKSD